METDILDQLDQVTRQEQTTTPETKTETTSQESVVEKTVDSKVETKENQEDVLSKFNEPETWTKETALKEVKKLREENKTTRLKYQEQLDSFKTKMEEELTRQHEEFKEALEAKKQLNELKAKEEDKKRSMEEKLAHREASLVDLENKYKAAQAEFEAKMEEMNSKLSNYEVEREAQLSVYKERIKQELDSLPEKYRKFAEQIAKGHSDPREAWTALSEAKMSGLFEDKKVIVSHATPGASEGARTTDGQIKAAERAELDKLTSQQKISAGLSKVGNLQSKII